MIMGRGRRDEVEQIVRVVGCWLILNGRCNTFVLGTEAVVCDVSVKSGLSRSSTAQRVRMCRLTA